MKERTRRTALVTGASAGIGRAFAEAYAARGHDLVLTARRRERLEALAKELAEKHSIRATVIEADLTDPAAPKAIFDRTEADGIAVDALVNNAGYGLTGSYLRTSWEAQRDFIQLMVTAVAHLTHLYLPGMVQRHYGRVIQVSSLAAFVPGAPGHTAYGAAKSFLVKFAEALHLELQGTGVHITAACPGFTWSEFHDVSGTRAAMNKLPSFVWMDAESVARQSIEAVDRGTPVLVNGAWNRFVAGVMKHIPDGAALAVMQRSAKRRARDRG